MFLLLVFSSTIVVAQEPKTLVAFGDSTTARRGDLKIYAGLLQRELPQAGLPIRVVNAGVGGHNTDHARVRFEADVLDYNPDVVVIQFGINDAAVDVWKDPPATEPRISKARYVENLRYFVRTLKARKVQVMLMTPNPLRWTPKMLTLYGKPPYLPAEPNGFNIKLQEYAEAVRQIAKSEDVLLIDIYRSFKHYGETEGNSVDDLLLDGIHPNEHGHRIAADLLIAKLLKQKTAQRRLKSPDIAIRIVGTPATSRLRLEAAGTP